MDIQTRYKMVVGAAALERQCALAKERFPCCGERREAGHHDACSKRPKEEIPEPLAGQTALV